MKVNMDKKEYDELIKKKSPNSPTGKNLLLAFLSGGIICTIGQIILNFFKGMGLDENTSSGATAATMILLGALLTGLNIYDKIAKHAGAGTLVPITGFANSIVSPALEFKSEGYVLGIGAKMFLIAGPVLVYGIVASVAAGIVYFLIKGA